MKKEKPPEFKFAEEYHSYALKYPVYRESINRLIDQAKKVVSKPQTIIDLACGTGITLTQILGKYPKVKLYCIDSSKEMLTIAKSNGRGLSYNISYIESEAEDFSSEAGIADVVFCSAAFWYFDKNKVLEKVRKALRKDGIFVFNMSEPSINFEDGEYDDRFLQTMVEVLDDRGIKFHRQEGKMAGRLKLSYQPPTTRSMEDLIISHHFKICNYRVWEFTKSLEELGDFYMIPGFGTKAFRELQNEDVKADVMTEIIRRLKAQNVQIIRFRWAEYVIQKKSR